MTIDKMAAMRDPVYAATHPVGAFDNALAHDRAKSPEAYRDAALLPLAIRALRNRGEPYYTQEVTA